VVLNTTTGQGNDEYDESDEDKEGYDGDALDDDERDDSR
jgi:hypothetical protein